MFESPFSPASLLPPVLSAPTYIISATNVPLYLHMHPVPNPRAGVAISHGLGEHAARYSHFIKLFNDMGISVYALDYEGFGRTVQMSGAKGRTRVAVTKYSLMDGNTLIHVIDHVNGYGKTHCAHTHTNRRRKENICGTGPRSVFGNCVLKSFNSLGIPWYKEFESYFLCIYIQRED
jgi:hypothetical protein